MTDPSEAPLWGLTVIWIDSDGAADETLWLYRSEELAREHAELVKLTAEAAKRLKGVELASLTIHEVTALAELPPEIQALRDRLV